LVETLKAYEDISKMDCTFVAKWSGLSRIQDCAQWQPLVLAVLSIKSRSVTAKEREIQSDPILFPHYAMITVCLRFFRLCMHVVLIWNSVIFLPSCKKAFLQKFMACIFSRTVI
jgi:hypothetical protein